MTITELIDNILDLKEGNQELMMYRFPTGTWEVHLGNPSCHVLLGEVPGEIVVAGTLEGALTNIHDELVLRKRTR